MTNRHNQPPRRSLFGSLRHTLHSLLWDAEWNIGIVHQPVHRFLEPGFTPEIQWLPGPARGHFSADPMLVAQDGKHYLLYEDLDFRSYQGRIHGVELHGHQPVGPVHTVFEGPVHLSYPYLLEHQGGVYCIPEMAGASEVALYRATELPHRWQRVAVLLPGVPAVDSTVFSFEGRWWLLGTLANAAGDPNVELHVWHAPDLFGPWTPHPANPVKRDLGSARPAGPPFMHQGCLYRPAQDCTQTYGGRVVLLKIGKLTPEDFQEEQVGVVEPDRRGRYPDGLHTLCGVGDLTVLDGKRFLFNWDAFKHALKVKWGRMKRRLLHS